MIVLLDEHLGTRLHTVLEACRQKHIITCCQRFGGPGAKDPDIIRAVAQDGYLFITIDHHIYTEEQSRCILAAEGATTIFLPRSVNNMRLMDRVIWFLRFWAKLDRKAIEPGCCYIVSITWQVRKLDLTRIPTTRKRTVRQRVLA